jgi:uncharacterized membrane protein (UPF0127 family)
VRTPTPEASARRRRVPAPALATLCSVVAVVAFAVGCVPTGERPELTGEPVEAVSSGGRPACPTPGPPFEQFGSTVIVALADGGPIERCVLVADTVELRARGLMEVQDLAGYDGMIFAFAEDTDGGFWMGNTHLPLTIAYIDANGVVITVLDMEPCPEAVDCPSYWPDGPYRWALEVPQGGLGAFGLGPGVQLDVASLPTTAR